MQPTGTADKHAPADVTGSHLLAEQPVGGVAGAHERGGAQHGAQRGQQAGGGRLEAQLLQRAAVACVGWVVGGWGGWCQAE
jgi:hypothetical protein